VNPFDANAPVRTAITTAQGVRTAVVAVTSG
jgi:hypothetical protein